VGETERIRKELGYEEPVPLGESLRIPSPGSGRNPPKEVDQKRFDYAAEDAALTSQGT